jgi:hypothetical protein
MSRDVRCFIIGENEAMDISWEVARVTGRPYSTRGVRIGGAGADVGFLLVFELAEHLHSDGYALKQRWL